MSKSHDNKLRCLTSAFFAISIFVLFQDPATAEPVNSDHEIAQEIFQGYLSKHKDVRLDTARTPISPTTSALIVRFASKETCRAGYCATALLLFSKDDGNWQVAFERHVKDLRIVKKVGRSGLYYLEADRGIWEWNGGPTYLPLISSLGDPFNTLRTIAPARITDRLSEILHSPEWIRRHPFSGKALYRVSASRIPVSKSASVWFAYAYAQGECGDSGCPSAVLQDTPDGPKTLWMGKSDGNGATAVTANLGWKDILVTTRQGYKGLTFDGDTYKESYTSYRSAYTRSP